MRHRRSPALAVAVAVMVMIWAALPARAGNCVWGPFGITDSSVTLQASTLPHVAFGDGRYLVVYSHAGQPLGGNPNDDIEGALVDPLRMTVSDVAVDVAGGDSSSPAVAYDAQNHRYLVVYEDRQAGRADRDIRARLLDADGGLLGSALLAATSLDELSPDVAGAGNGTFTVAWCRTTSAGAPADAMVLAVNVSYDGTNLVAGPQPAIVNQDASGNHPGATCPRVVPGAGGLALVVWQQPFATSGPTVDTWLHDIKGRVLGSSCVPLGQVCGIAASARNKTLPSPAYDPAGDRFLIAWQEQAAAGNRDILAAVTTIDASGQVTTGPVLPVAALGYDDTCPQVSWNPARRQFLVAWEARFSASDHDVYARQVDPAGSMDVEFAVAETTLMERRPAIARGAGEFLAVWESEDVGTWPCDVAAAFLMDQPPAPRVVSVTPRLLEVQNKSDALTSLTVSFNMPVRVTTGDVTVTGLATGPRGDFAFHYDDTACQVTLTWAAPLADDTYILTIKDTVQATDGMALDGESDLYSPSLPSGDGAVGGDFRGLIYRLAGDINGDLSVDVVDLLYLVDAFGVCKGDMAFNAQADLNQDDGVDVVDLLILVEHWGGGIPAGL